MKITLGKNLTDFNRLNTVAIENEFMSGDADVYHTEELHFPFNIDLVTDNDFDRIGPHKSGVTFEQAYNLVTQMQAIAGNSNGDREAMQSEFEKLEHFEALFPEWPGDSTTDFSVPSQYEGFRVKYYNLAGIPFEIHVEP